MATAITGEQALTVIKEWKSSAKLRAEFGGNFNRYSAYVRATVAGKVKIIGNRR